MVDKMNEQKIWIFVQDDRLDGVDDRGTGRGHDEQEERDQVGREVHHQLGFFLGLRWAGDGLNLAPEL